MKLGEAYVELKANSAQLKTGLMGAESMVTKWALTAGAMAGAYFAKQFVQESIKLAREQEHIERRLEAVVRATGAAAGFTATHLREMAAGLQQVSIFGDEAIMQAQTLLLTFKQITGEAFGRTIKVAMDMAAIGMGDLRSNALQLGKALQDPVRQLTMLRRSGLTFGEAEEKVITALAKAGEMAKAQALILDALEKQLGGASTATDSWADKTTQAANAWGDLKEKVGGTLGPALAASFLVFTDFFRYAGESRDQFADWASALQGLNREWLDAEKAAAAARMQTTATTKQRAEAERQLAEEIRKTAQVAEEARNAELAAETKHLRGVPGRIESLAEGFAISARPGSLASEFAQVDRWARGIRDEIDAITQNAELWSSLTKDQQATLSRIYHESAQRAGERKQELQAEAEARELAGLDVPDETKQRFRDAASAEAQLVDMVTNAKIRGLEAAGKLQEAQTLRTDEAYRQEMALIEDQARALEELYGENLPDELLALINSAKMEAEMTRARETELKQKQEFGYRTASLREIGLAAQGKLGGGGAAGKDPEEEVAETTKKMDAKLATIATLLRDRTFEARYR